MKLLLISYDLKAPGRNYKTLYEVLRSTQYWCHYLESTWILVTGESIENLSDRIHDAIDVNDIFIIVDITGKERHGWLPKKAWQWFQSADRSSSNDIEE